MKQKYQLTVYLIIMSAVIIGSLSLAREHQGNCPVCNHSMSTEGMVKVSPVVKANY